MSEVDETKDKDKPESLTINVDKTTLDLIRDRMTEKYNNFWGDVIDDEQKRTIEIADKLSPGEPYEINGKPYDFRQVGMKRWRELSKIKMKGDSEKNTEIQMDLFTQYYTEMLKEFFGMTEDAADRVPPGEARLLGDASAYKVLHPVPLHPEKLRSGSTNTSLSA